MFTTTFDKLRDEPGKAVATIGGLVMILLLLWAIGHVVQQQVQTAQGRDYGQAQAPDPAQSCAAANAECAKPEAWSTSGGPGTALRPVFASYR